MLYASAKRGFKAGGFNANQAQRTPFDPERRWAYEAVAKGQVGGVATLSATGFVYDYRDIQVTRVVPAPSGVGTLLTIENAAAASIDGLELSTAGNLHRAFAVDAAATYLKARYDRYTTLNPSDPTQNPNRAGNPLPKAPQWTVNLGATMTADVAAGVKLTGRAEYRRQSAMFLNAFRDPFMRQDAYDLINARLALSRDDERWTIAVIGRNLGNTLYAAGASRVRGQTGNVRIWGPPRQYGVELAMAY